jgi:hypothetical protein
VLPPKKAIGNKDIKFINERRYYLERYLKKMSHFPFIVNSTEFRIFTRPNGDVEKQLSACTKQHSWEIAEKLKESLGIREELYEPRQLEELDKVCRDF